MNEQDDLKKMNQKAEEYLTTAKQMSKDCLISGCNAYKIDLNSNEMLKIRFIR